MRRGPVAAWRRRRAIRQSAREWIPRPPVIDGYRQTPATEEGPAPGENWLQFVARMQAGGTP
ncbi:hypothetical protein [Rhodococcoides fascians]|uniref:hypothetical protein n=1 Tax=Rhodococcoides fascians TaxID=1828 RepID=UPI000B0F5D07|nr:hypothetical protein [Rhodococcus fascians]